MSNKTNDGVTTFKANNAALLPNQLLSVQHNGFDLSDSNGVYFRVGDDLNVVSKDCQTFVMGYDDVHVLAEKLLRMRTDYLIASGTFSGKLSPERAQAAVEAGLRVCVAQKCIITGADEYQWYVWKDQLGTWATSPHGTRKSSEGFGNYREWKVWSGTFVPTLAEQFAKHRSEKAKQVVDDFMTKETMKLVKERMLPNVPLYYSAKERQRLSGNKTVTDSNNVRRPSGITPQNAVFRMMDGCKVYPATQYGLDRKQVYRINAAGKVVCATYSGQEQQEGEFVSKNGPGSQDPTDDKWLVFNHTEKPSKTENLTDAEALVVIKAGGEVKSQKNNLVYIWRNGACAYRLESGRGFGGAGCTNGPGCAKSLGPWTVVVTGN